MNDDRIVRSLDEDFAKIGWGGGTKELNRLSSTRLDESLYSAPPVQFDPIDGPMVTMDLLNRIADLDFDSLDEDDCNDILDGLRDKELPDHDVELAEAAEAVVKALLESRKMITQFDSRTGKKSRRAAAGYHNVDGKVVKVKLSDARKVARKRTRYDKRTAGKQATYDRTVGARLQNMADRKGLGAKSAKANKRQPTNADDMSDGLVLELNHILGESDNSKFGAYGDTVSRVARIMNLLEYALGEEVGDVLETAYAKMENSLLTESSEPARAFDPALRVIARCLEQVDALGND